jgi:hypothetical protein
VDWIQPAQDRAEWWAIVNRLKTSKSKGKLVIKHYVMMTHGGAEAQLNDANINYISN